MKSTYKLSDHSSINTEELQVGYTSILKKNSDLHLHVHDCMYLFFNSVCQIYVRYQSTHLKINAVTVIEKKYNKI